MRPSWPDVMMDAALRETVAAAAARPTPPPPCAECRRRAPLVRAIQAEVRELRAMLTALRQRADDARGGSDDVDD